MLHWEVCQGQPISLLYEGSDVNYRTLFFQVMSVRLSSSAENSAMLPEGTVTSSSVLHVSAEV
jgi:hypothetical protein